MRTQNKAEAVQQFLKRLKDGLGMSSNASQNHTSRWFLVRRKGVSHPAILWPAVDALIGRTLLLQVSLKCPELEMCIY